MRRLALLSFLALACGGGPEPADAGPDAATPECAARGDVHALCITVAEADWELLHQDPIADTEILVDLVIDGERHRDVTFKLHGGYARTVPKKSYRFHLAAGDLAEVDLFGDGVEGLDRLVLQAAWIDPTFLRNKLTLDLVRAAGGLAPRVGFARLTVNGVDHGLYTTVERVDDVFLAKHGLPADCNLYKAEGNEADWRPKADDLLGYDQEIGAPPNADLTTLIDTCAATPETAADFAAAVEPLLDVEDVLVYQRVHTFAMNRDAYTKNYLLYHDLTAPPGTAAARFRLISWDADATFGLKWEGTPLDSEQTDWHGWDGFSPRLLSIPEYLGEYVLEYTQSLDGALAVAPILARIDAAAAVIRADARSDLALWQPEKDFDVEVERLRASALRRHEVMSGVIAGLAGS